MAANNQTQLTTPPRSRRRYSPGRRPEGWRAGLDEDDADDHHADAHPCERAQRLTEEHHAENRGERDAGGAPDPVGSGDRDPGAQRHPDEDEGAGIPGDHQDDPCLVVDCGAQRHRRGHLGTDRGEQPEPLGHRSGPALRRAQMVAERLEVGKDLGGGACTVDQPGRFAGVDRRQR